MQTYSVIPYLKLLIQARGVPLHQLSALSGISEDDLLDLLSARQKISNYELEVLCAVLRGHSRFNTVATDAEQVSTAVQQRLNRLKALDNQMLDCIQTLYATGAKRYNKPTESPSQEVDQAWLSTLHVLKDMYEGYHQDLKRMLGE